MKNNLASPLQFWSWSRVKFVKLASTFFLHLGGWKIVNKKKIKIEKMTLSSFFPIKSSHTESFLDDFPINFFSIKNTFYFTQQHPSKRIFLPVEKTCLFCPRSTQGFNWWQGLHLSNRYTVDWFLHSSPTMMSSFYTLKLVNACKQILEF